MANNEKKNQRMELRREIGSRMVKSAPSSSSSRQLYLAAHACFNCRKSFKLSCETNHICPECSEPIYLMGRSFKAPKRNDDEQWRKVQKLYALGFRFHRYGGDYLPLPERFREIDRFVEQYPEHELRVAENDLSLLPEER
jgi:DNA-directed RNA polymerase subunit RPC12/RpoP